MVVTFEGYLPDPRYDSHPWTRAIIEESITAAGPWNQIDLITFADPDADPTQPKQRSFTTENATLASGWYRVTFTDAGGNAAQPTSPVYNGEEYTFEPTIDQVARKILSRTRDQYGNIQATFTPTTNPTDAQTQQIARDVVTEIADVIGDVIPPVLYDDAQNVAALKTAMQIELDFFPDQVNTGRSTYTQLKEEYDAALASLQRAVTTAEDDGGTVIDTGPAMRSSYSFPDPCKSIGLKTRW